MDATPDILHAAVTEAVLRRQVLKSTGDVAAVDQMEAAIRDCFRRAGLLDDQIAHKQLRIGLVAFMHALVARSFAMAEHGLVPETAPESVAAISAELGAVVIGDEVAPDEVTDAYRIATTEDEEVYEPPTDISELAPVPDTPPAPAKRRSLKVPLGMAALVAAAALATPAAWGKGLTHVPVAWGHAVTTALAIHHRPPPPAPVRPAASAVHQRMLPTTKTKSKPPVPTVKPGPTGNAPLPEAVTPAPVTSPPAVRVEPEKVSRATPSSVSTATSRRARGTAHTLRVAPPGRVKTEPRGKVRPRPIKATPRPKVGVQHPAVKPAVAAHHIGRQPV